MANRALFLVGYDISDSKLQSYIRELTKNHAIDGQKSAYECWLLPHEKAELINAFIEAITPLHDAGCIIAVQSCYWYNMPKKYPIHAPTPDFLYIG